MKVMPDRLFDSEAASLRMGCAIPADRWFLVCDSEQEAYKYMKLLEKLKAEDSGVLAE